MVQINNSTVMFLPKNSLKKSQGFVLIVTLVFLVALTGVAAALMQNTTSDMKMSGATNEKVVATQGALSAIDESINYQMNVSATNVFTEALNKVGSYTSADLLPTTTKTKATASASVINNPTFEDIPCPRSRTPSSDGIICSVMELQVDRQYGRNNTSTITVRTNITQELLPVN